MPMFFSIPKSKVIFISADPCFERAKKRLKAVRVKIPSSDHTSMGFQRPSLCWNEALITQTFWLCVALDSESITPLGGNLIFVHYSDVMMSAKASQITSVTIVYSTVYSRRRSKKTSKLRVTGLCEGNSPVTGEFPAQMGSNAENVSIWWRHHVHHTHQNAESITRWSWNCISDILWISEAQYGCSTPSSLLCLFNVRNMKTSRNMWENLALNGQDHIIS